MFTHYKAQGIILDKKDRGEADRIFIVYTKEFGKLELLAKAVRKIKSKLRGALELFYLSDIEFIQGKTHKTLTDAVLVDNFQNIKRSLKRLKIAYQVSETLNDLVKEEESDEKIWQLLKETFEKLNTIQLPAAKYQLLYHYFLWNLLSVSGYQPELYHCAFCQKKLSPENIFLSPKEGGLLCSKCSETIKNKKSIASDAVKIIRILIKRDWSMLARLKIGNDDFKNLKAASHYYLSLVLEQIK